MLITIISDKMDTLRLANIQDNLLKKMYVSFVTNPRKEGTITVIETDLEINEDVFITDYIASEKWSFPDKVYVIIVKDSKAGISSFKGNHKGEFTRIFRNGIVVNMFV